MKQFYMTEEMQKLKFAELAARHFAANPLDLTFTEKGILQGAYMALRWGLGNNCVVVVKLDDYEDPVNYCDLIPTDRAHITGEIYKAAKARLKELDPQPKKDF
ncbi:MAG: hypothetical protein EBR82_66995 [Caulobacteraceae bacterium]|nr:hypothetical protein [Caulobacteraceae bacterium]